MNNEKPPRLARILRKLTLPKGYFLADGSGYDVHSVRAQRRFAIFHFDHYEFCLVVRRVFMTLRRFVSWVKLRFANFLRSKCEDGIRAEVCGLVSAYVQSFVKIRQLVEALLLGIILAAAVAIRVGRSASNSVYGLFASRVRAPGEVPGCEFDTRSWDRGHKRIGRRLRALERRRRVKYIRRGTWQYEDRWNPVHVPPGAHSLDGSGSDVSAD